MDLKVKPANLSAKIEPCEFIAGFFPVKHVTLIASKAGVGKTWFCAWLMAQVSQGGMIFFDRTLQREPKRCVYFAGEAGTDLIVERLQNIQIGMKELQIQVFSALDILKAGGKPYLETEEGAKQLTSLFYLYQPHIVIFDSLMSFRNSDESNQYVSNTMMTNVRRIAEANNTAVICTHHLRKRSSEQMVQQIDQDEIIGSSALVRNASCAFTLTGQGSVKTLKCVKTWWKKPETLTYEMKDVEGKVDFQPTTQTDNESLKRLKIYNILQRTKGTEIGIAELAREYKVSRCTVYNALEMCDYQKTDRGKVIILGAKTGGGEKNDKLS